MARPLRLTNGVLDPVLVMVTGQLCELPAAPDAVSWLLDRSRVLPTARPLLRDSASWTALRLFSRPAPCSAAGAPRSVALLSRICLTCAGDGVAPPCVCR